MNNFWWGHFREKPKNELGGLLKVKIHILFYGDNSWTVALIVRGMKSGIVKVIYIPTSFIWVIIFFDGTLEYGDDAKFWGYVGSNFVTLCVELCNFVQPLPNLSHYY
jgi:hypothetical protein